MKFGEITFILSLFKLFSVEYFPDKVIKVVVHFEIHVQECVFVPLEGI